MNNYYTLLKIKYKNHFLIFVIWSILLLSIFLSITIKVYDSYTCYGIYQNENLYLNIPLSNSDNILKGKYLKINKVKYTYKINEISDLKYEGNINYQTYQISINETFKENEIVKITFYSNKEIIMKKIIKLIF